MRLLYPVFLGLVALVNTSCCGFESRLVHCGAFRLESHKINRSTIAW